MNEGADYKGAAFQSIVKYFQALMVLVYAVLGIMILWSPQLFNLTTNYSVPLGCILVAYSVLRGYRVYQKYFY